MAYKPADLGAVAGKDLLAAMQKEFVKIADEFSCHRRRRSERRRALAMGRNYRRAILPPGEAPQSRYVRPGRRQERGAAPHHAGR